MRNESNNEVRIIDENYAKIYDSIQEVVSKEFQNINLEENAENLSNLIRNIFNKLMSRFLGNQNDNPNSNFNNQKGNQNQEEQYQSLPNPNYQDIKDQMERDISNMVQQLLQHQNLSQNSQSQQNEGQQGNNQSQQGEGNQQSESVQKALQSLISKQDKKSVKEVDENFEGKDNQAQTDSLEEQFENMNLDNSQQQGQSQQSEGQQGNGQQGEGQQGEGNQQNESVQKALSTLVPKQGNGESNGQEVDSDGEMGEPNLDEETPITATYNDSDELTKLNVDWTSEDNSFRERERTVEHVRTRIDDNMLDAIMKYLVKTNYYVKTYGLDKKNRKQIAKHFLLDLEHKIMTDTYSDVKEPLAFYIDMKGQCSELGEYNTFFRKLLNEKDISIYFGYDGKVVKYLKVKKPDANLEFDKCDMCHYFQNSDRLPSGDELDGHYESKIFDEQLPLEEFIRSHRISRLIALSDYDAAVSIIRSSLLAKVYWFCTAAYCGDIDSSYYSLNDFRGEFIIADDKEKVMEYFDHIYDPSYENKQRKLQLKGSRW